jgi:RNA polymerase sigma-70 factor, ECF subfamily
MSMKEKASMKDMMPNALSQAFANSPRELAQNAAAYRSSSFQWYLARKAKGAPLSWQRGAVAVAEARLLSGTQMEIKRRSERFVPSTEMTSSTPPSMTPSSGPSPAAESTSWAGANGYAPPMTPERLREQELVRQLQSGNTKAMREVVAANRLLVTRLVLSMGVPRADLEDLIQDVFVQVYRSIKDFRGQAKLSTWVHRIAVNVVLMHRRALRSRPTYVSDEETTLQLIDEGQDGSPLEEVARRQRIRAFDRVLSRISEKKREVFVLHEIEGFSPTEIAEMVSAPVLTVRTRLFYARKEIETLLLEEPSLATLSQELKEASASEGGGPAQKSAVRSKKRAVTNEASSPSSKDSANAGGAA